LDLNQFTDALFELCIADGDDSFACSYLDNYKSAEDDAENMRASILHAAVEKYFADESSDEEDD
jgi:hypothetical protein